MADRSRPMQNSTDEIKNSPIPPDIVEANNDSAIAANPITEPDPVLKPDPAETVPEGVEDRNTGSGDVVSQVSDRMATGSDPTGGDVDTNLGQAKVVGEEAVGGTTPTPDQDVVDEIAASVGVEVPDKKPIQVSDDLERRDDQRWELDPQSSEDYRQHKP
ncbi:MAG TPA: DUF6335 family protein [Elainellaceae cyanobacterium]